MFFYFNIGAVVEHLSIDVSCSDVSCSDVSCSDVSCSDVCANIRHSNVFFSIPAIEDNPNNTP